MRNYESYSYWLEDTGEPLIPLPPLSKSVEVDIAILGGGYSGLWTAYYLSLFQPSLKIAIVEKEIVGFGGSGRNGGWCSPRFPLSAGMLAKRYGSAAARAQLRAVQASVDEIQRVCEQENIDALFRAGGTLTLARSQHQLHAINASYSAYKHLGLADHYQLLTPEQSAERIKVINVLGALYTPAGASLHPGRLVRGLARAVEARGVVIYEQTPVISYTSGQKACLTTPNGELRASKAIVFAGEAYLTRFPRLHRSLLPAYSLICLTEPLTPDQWQQIGWQQGENVASARNTVVYLTKTADGRILFGSRGAPYAFASRITDQQDRHAETLFSIQQSLLKWFPSLAGIKFTHAWGGPVAMPSDWMPSVHFNPTSKIATIGGYTGQGVSTSNLAGKLLAGVLTNQSTNLESLPILRPRSSNWMIEPFRWLIVRSMQRALLHLDEATEAGKPRPLSGVIAEFLGKH